MISIQLKQDIDIPTEDKINAAILKAEERISIILENYAKTNHRYKNRSGNLQRATKVDHTRSSIKAYINDKLADYGSAIHYGYKKWAPDPFIEKAIANNSEIIEQILTEELDKVM